MGIMSSCGSVELLSYDQLTPAEIFLPNQISHIGVVNNMAVRSEPRQDILTLGLLDGNGKDCAEELAGKLADSKYFNQVIICDSALQSQRTVSNDNYMTQLTGNEVNRLTNELGVDMLVSFEHLWVEVSKQEVQYPGWETFVPLLQAKYTPVVRLYLPERNQPMLTVNLTDSLHWNIGSGISEKQVLEEVSSLAAEQLVKKMVPTWNPTERVFFTGGCVEMRDAAICVHENDWTAAQTTWKTLFERLKKGNTKVRAAYNIALSYEMLGDVDAAEQWIETAKKYIKNDSQEAALIKKYAEILSTRKTEMANLKLQMDRFQNKF